MIGLAVLPLIIGSVAAKAQDFKVGVVGNVGALAVFVAVEKGFSRRTIST